MTKTISNSYNVIDSRDVMSRIEELEELLQKPEFSKEDAKEF